MPNRSFETACVHAGERGPLPKGLPSATPIFATSTYSYESMEDAERVFTGELQDYIYVRHGNPTVEALQNAVCELENAAVARCFGSGMAASHAALLACGLEPGSVVLVSRDLYGASFALIRDILGPLGVRMEVADFSDVNALQAKTHQLRPRVLFAETISNPLLKVLDIAAVAHIAHAAEARLIVDSTFATPFLARPLDHGVDFVVHSATKYLSGSGDAIGGVVAARDAADEPALTKVMRLAGGILSVWEAHSISRGLRTLALRMERQCTNAETIAQRLSSHPKINTVHYPKLSADGLADRILRNPFGGALVSIVLAEDTREAAWRFMNSLRLCLRATTLGDVFTNVSHSSTSSHRELSPGQRAGLGISDGLVRISVGIEDVEDILNDIDQALRN